MKSANTIVALSCKKILKKLLGFSWNICVLYKHLLQKKPCAVLVLTVYAASSYTPVKLIFIKCLLQISSILTAHTSTPHHTPKQCPLTHLFPSRAATCDLMAELKTSVRRRLHCFYKCSLQQRRHQRRNLRASRDQQREFCTPRVKISRNTKRRTLHITAVTK